MRKKWLAMLMVVVMIIGSLSACGNKETASNDTSNKDAKTDSATVAKDTGKVLKIYCWNEEFKSRFEDYYKTNANGMLDGIDVQFVTTPSEGNAYQNKLDADLLKNKTAAAEDKIDMFLIEADYALKYVNTNSTLDVKELGITDSDTSNQYQYTKDIATSTDGKLKALSWQATPGLFVYRRSIAKQVFGTDDPAKMQENLSSWDKFDAAAQKVHDTTQGKTTMLSGYDDAYRTFSNNVSSPWVDSNSKITIDPNIMTWVDQTKNYTDKAYNAKTALWSDEWKKGQSPAGSVFGYFYSTWGIAFTLKEQSLKTPVKEGGKEEVGNGIFGDWAACPGPQSYYWGGTWICCAPDSDNKNLVADVMKKLTCNKDIMKKITKEEDDFTNNKAAIKEIINEGYKSAFLGGQDHISLLTEAADKVNMKNISAYDQGLNESFQGAMKDYFDGTVTKDKALETFYASAIEKYPNLKKE